MSDSSQVATHSASTTDGLQTLLQRQIESLLQLVALTSNGQIIEVDGFVSNEIVNLVKSHEKPVVTTQRQD